VLADLPDLIVFENVVGFDVGLLHDILGALYCVQAVEMRPEDLGFSFILRPRVYAILARKTSVDLDADAFSLFRQLQAGACRQRTAPPAVMAASDEELLQEENSARMARGMLALDRPSGNWRYLLPKSQVKRLADHEKISDDDRGYGLGGGFVAEPSFWAMVSVRSYYAALDRQAAVASSA
jgi:hypothetical protein